MVAKINSLLNDRQPTESNRLLEPHPLIHLAEGFNADGFLAIELTYHFVIKVFVGKAKVWCADINKLNTARLASLANSIYF